jgi:hypothetical protein
LGRQDRHLPPSYVKRIKREILLELDKIDPDINKAIEILLEDSGRGVGGKRYITRDEAIELASKIAETKLHAYKLDRVQ